VTDQKYPIVVVPPWTTYQVVLVALTAALVGFLVARMIDNHRVTTRLEQISDCQTEEIETARTLVICVRDLAACHHGKGEPWLTPKNQ
jgi:hypothetical protein